ncbi:MAG: rRNA maturation RNase YbeY [Chloroflexota bacterium]
MNDVLEYQRIHRLVDIQVDDAFMDELRGEPEVNLHQIAKAIYETLVRLERVPSSENRHISELPTLVTLVITDNDYAQELNKTYRDVDAPTDILSFPSSDEAETDQPTDIILPPELQDEVGWYLGDLVIAYPYVRKQAIHYGNTLEAELLLLAVHGTLHLIGYDHMTQDEEAVMWSVKEEVLAQFGYAGLAAGRGN